MQGKETRITVAEEKSETMCIYVRVFLKFNRAVLFSLQNLARF
jgi:hypothetical protein